MTGRASLQRRAWRAIVFALLMTSTAVAAHALAGGMVPSAATIAGSAAALAVVGWALGARRRHAVVLVAAAVTGQLALHVAFAASMQAASRSQALALVLCGHADGSTRIPLAAMAGMGGARAPEAVWSVGWMTAAHCLAAAVVVLAARHGEDLVAGLTCFVRSRLGVPRPAPAPHRTPSRARVVTSSLPVAWTLRLTAGNDRRGPPLRCS